MCSKTRIVVAVLFLLFRPLSMPGAKTDERVVYAPDILGVERLFMVALKIPTDVPEVQASIPDSVTLLDRTPLPAESEIRKFYFRTVKPAKKAEIRFRLPDSEVVVPVEIWSFEDLRQFRKLKGVQLPRRWPLGQLLPELKERQMFPTGAEEKEPDGSSSGGWLDVPDDAIWDMQPDSTIPRWHWVNLPLGCPVHGTDIYEKVAYYPWGMEGSRPWNWKIRCPVGGELYPSNDFAAGDMTGGEFPDDGIGGGYVRDGKHYGFVAELCQFYCRRMMTVAPACADRYVATGDPRYVHKALVAFCRLATEYAYLATMTHHRHRNNVGQVERLGQGRFDEGPYLQQSGFNVYCIEQPNHQISHADAYDKIFPAIDKDPDIIPFLKQKGFQVQTHEDVRRFIDRTTGVQTLSQMQGLVKMVRQYGCVPEDDILDMFGYKAVYNEALLNVVGERVEKFTSGRVAATDFQLENALDLLRALQDRGVTLYLASGTDREDVVAEATALGYADLFGDRIFGAVGDINIEAKREVMEHIIREHGLAGAEFATFGDGPVEIRECHKRGGVAVGVACNEVQRFGLDPAKRARLIRAGADLIVPDFRQLETLLAVLGF